MSVYKLYYSGTADGNAALDISNDGQITCICGTMTPQGQDVLNEGAQIEVSFSSASAFTVHDTRASFFGMASVLGVVTTGGGNGAVNEQVSGVSIRVAQGERIFLHVNVIGTLAAFEATVWLYVEDGVDARPARRIRQG